MKKSLSTPARPRFSPGRPCACDTANRIEQLLDVATEVFLESGYQGASMDQIAMRAGASKQTLYSRFPSKAELFKAVMQRRTEAIHLRFAGILFADRAFPEVLAMYGREILQKLLDPDEFRFLRTLIATVDSFPDLSQNFWALVSKSGHDEFEEYLRIQVKSGTLRDLDPKLASDMFFGMCTGRFLLPVFLGIQGFPDLRTQRKQVKEAVQTFMLRYGAEL